MDTLHNSVQVLFVSKQIPWIIQAKMAEDGYVTMEDLACRWVSAEKAPEEGPKDLQFRDGENGFDKSNSDFSAMRLYQAVVQARSLLHSGKAPSLSDGMTGFNLDALCDRVALEKDWVNQTGQPKPRLEYQGSDSFLKKQFRYCAKGEIGYFAPKHIISALPEEGERPTKSHRKFTVDGFEKEEEEEERANPQTRRQLERMHMVFRNNLLMCTLAFPQFQQFDITKSDLDEWYDWFYRPSIAGRRPPPSEFTLLWSERNAWRQIYQLMADGSTLKTAMKTIKEDQLFWTREVYERVLFQQLKTPRDPKGKGKGKDKGKKGGKTKGVYQDHLKNNPGKGNGKNDKSSKGGRPNGWPQNWALQAPNGVQYCRDFHLKHTCPGNCGRSHACPVRVNGWTCNGDHSPDKCPSKGKIAGMIQRAGKRAPRMTSQSVLRLMGQETWRTILCQRPNHSLPIQLCGRHLGVRNPPILQKPKRTSQNPVGASLLWLPLWTSHSYKNFFHGPPLFQSGSNKGSFGTHQYHHMRYKHQPSYCYILARQTQRVWTPCF